MGVEAGSVGVQAEGERVKLTPLVFVAFCTVVGVLAGSWAWGCAVGLGIVLVVDASVIWKAL